MLVRSVVLLTAMLGAAAVARAETAPSARGLFETVWKSAQCNQGIDQALNNSRYHELGGGYSLGMVLCWLGPNSESQILFLVAPKTGGRPQLLRLQAWRNKTFVPDDVLWMADFDPSTKTLTSYQRYAGSGICAQAGEWMWKGTEFSMTGYWDKPDCKHDGEFDRGDRYRVFPPRG